jgi:hypothetical protein
MCGLVLNRRERGAGGSIRELAKGETERFRCPFRARIRVGGMTQGIGRKAPSALGSVLGPRWGRNDPSAGLDSGHRWGLWRDWSGPRTRTRKCRAGD